MGNDGVAIRGVGINLCVPYRHSGNENGPPKRPVS